MSIYKHRPESLNHQTIEPRKKSRELNIELLAVIVFCGVFWTLFTLFVLFVTDKATTF